VMGRSQQLGLIRRPGKKERELARAALAEVGSARSRSRRFAASRAGSSSGCWWRARWSPSPSCWCSTSDQRDGPGGEHALLLSLVSELSATRKIGVIFVTHEISTAAGFGKQVC